jgi:hypothetical protein
MGITYDRSKEIESVLDRALKWHPVLLACGVKIEVLEAAKTGKAGELKPALKCHGQQAAMLVRVVPLDRRVLGEGDALIIVDRLSWNEATLEQRLALLDHELEHIRVLAEYESCAGRSYVGWDPKEGTITQAPMLDDHGRPRLKIRLHDYDLGGFRSVIERHKQNSLESRQVDFCVLDSGQFIWEWAATPKQKKLPEKVA